MKIGLTSDIHLEFGEWVPSNPENADVLILSGDICVAKDLADRDTFNVMGEHTRSNMFHRFFEACCTEFKNVIYVMGNHEHYNGDFAVSYKKLKEKLAYLKNLHILEREVVTIDDVTFIGGTLWTDMNKEDPITLHAMKRMMNDFRCVDNSNREAERWVPTYKLNDDGSTFKDEKGFPVPIGEKRSKYVPLLSPEDVVEEHRAMLGYIKNIVAENGSKKYVVVGHHSPSKQSTKPRYQNDTVMNGGYSSDLSEFILDRPQIKAWTHGHTHDVFDYMIGSTRVLCNPRGYVMYERGTDEEEPYLPLVFEV
jgi:predicted phosphodiesterase